MNSPFLRIAVALLLAACGGAAPDVDKGSTASPGASAAAGAPDPGPAAAWAGTYSGVVTLPRGRFTYTWPAIVEVEATGPGTVRALVRDLHASVDHVDIVPPDVLVILVAPPGDRSFLLPSGDRVEVGSIHPRFDEDGRTLTVTLNGEAEGVDLEWTFVGTR